MYGVVFRGRRYDTGDRLDYLKAIVQLASDRDDLGPDFRPWLKQFAGTSDELGLERERLTSEHSRRSVTGRSRSARSGCATRAPRAELVANRGWLRSGRRPTRTARSASTSRASIRSLLSALRGPVSVCRSPSSTTASSPASSTSRRSRYGSLSSASIGYWVAERFAGHNVTPTAVALATDHCFFTLGLHRMEICIRPENAPSLRVVEKLGFRYEGLRRRFIHINGDWRDHFCFALTVEELPQGVLRRWKDGRVPEGAARIPEADLQAHSPLRLG